MPYVDIPTWDIYNTAWAADGSTWTVHESTRAQDSSGRTVDRSTQIVLDPTAENSESKEPIHPLGREIDIWGYTEGGFGRIEKMIACYRDAVPPAATNGKAKGRG